MDHKLSITDFKIEPIKHAVFHQVPISTVWTKVTWNEKYAWHFYTCLVIPVGMQSLSCTWRDSDRFESWYDNPIDKLEGQLVHLIQSQSRLTRLHWLEFNTCIQARGFR